MKVINLLGPTILRLNILVLLDRPLSRNIPHPEFLSLVDEQRTALARQPHAQQFCSVNAVFRSVACEPRYATCLVVVFAEVGTPAGVSIDEGLPFVDDIFESSYIPVFWAEFAAVADVHVHTIE